MNRSSRAKPLRTTPFDAAEYLVDEETQLAYLNAALAEGDAQAMVTALGTVAQPGACREWRSVAASGARACTRP